MTSWQAGHRSTTPGARTKASSEPISPRRPQCAHWLPAAVISTPNVSSSMPATALPSSTRSRTGSSRRLFISRPRRPESLRADALVAQPEVKQPVRRGLDKRGRAADERERSGPERPAHVAEHVLVDAPSVALPARRLRARERVEHLQPVAPGEGVELLAVDDVLARPRAVQQSGRYAGARRGAVPQPGHERHDAR